MALREHAQLQHTLQILLDETGTSSRGSGQLIHSCETLLPAELDVAFRAPQPSFLEDAQTDHAEESGQKHQVYDKAPKGDVAFRQNCD